VGRPPGVCCPQLRGHAPSNYGTPDRQTAPSLGDVASLPVSRRFRGGGSGPAPWPGAGHNHPPPRSPPQKGCRGQSAEWIGPTPHWLGVARGPHRLLAAFTPPVTHVGPTPPHGPTRAPRSHPPPHARLRDSSAPPRDVTHLRSLRHGVRRLVPPPTPRRAVHSPPPWHPQFLDSVGPRGPPPPLFHNAVTFTPLVGPRTRRPPDYELSASAPSFAIADEEMRYSAAVGPLPCCPTR